MRFHVGSPVLPTDARTDVRSRDYQNSSGGYCLVPRPYYCLRPMSFGLRGLSEFLRLRQTRTSETLCVTLGGTLRSNLASCQSLLPASSRNNEEFLEDVVRLGALRLVVPYIESQNR